MFLLEESKIECLKNLVIGENPAVTYFNLGGLLILWTLG